MAAEQLRLTPMTFASQLKRQQFGTHYPPANLPANQGRSLTQRERIRGLDEEHPWLCQLLMSLARLRPPIMCRKLWNMPSEPTSPLLIMRLDE